MLNLVETNPRDRNENSDFFHKKPKGRIKILNFKDDKKMITAAGKLVLKFQIVYFLLEPKKKSAKDFTEQRSSTPKQVIYMFFSS